MIKKTVTYVDYNGVERTEDFHFNLTSAEVMDAGAHHPRRLQRPAPEDHRRE